MKSLQSSPSGRFPVVIMMFIVAALAPTDAIWADDSAQSVDSSNPTPPWTWNGVHHHWRHFEGDGWTNYPDASGVSPDSAATTTPTDTASPTDPTPAADPAAIDPSTTDPTRTTTADSASTTPDATFQPLAQTILPSTVTALMATPTSSSQVTLRWNVALDIGGLGLGGYQIYRDGTLIATTLLATEFIDSTVSPNTTYCYTVLGYDVVGNAGPPSAEACASTPPVPQGNPTLSGYFVDYSSGSDANPGTSATTPWQHCPGDSAAIGVPAATTLKAGNVVWFKQGVTYVFTVGIPNPPVVSPGIQCYWSGVTYASTNAWTTATGAGKARFTDNYAQGYHYVAFWDYYGASNLTFDTLNIGPMG
ncbi:MAG TPA: hypothetical protein VMP11_01935, partial [Verrucomicrobiae bacterium]|nr:hypothetical protein [Verrucomicrobiae bacterium]